MKSFFRYAVKTELFEGNDPHSAGEAGGYGDDNRRLGFDSVSGGRRLFNDDAGLYAGTILFMNFLRVALIDFCCSNMCWEYWKSKILKSFEM